MKILEREAQPYPLNFLDRYLLANESPSIRFNSHFIIDLEPADAIDARALAAAIVRLVEQVPICRTFIVQGFFRFRRFSARTPWFDPATLLRVFAAHDAEAEERFYAEPFALRDQPPLRFLLTPNAAGGMRFVSSVHHSSCDAVAHIQLLQELFRLLNGKDTHAEARAIRPFLYRSLFLRLGLRWLATRAWNILNPFSRAARELRQNRRRQVATLVDDPTCKERRVRTLSFDVVDQGAVAIRDKARALAMSHTEVFVLTACTVLDRLLTERGDRASGLTLMLPTTQRAALRIRHGFQNVMGTLWLGAERAEIAGADFAETLKTRLRGLAKLTEASKFSLLAALATAFWPARVLRAICAWVDAQPDLIFNTLVISAGKVPARYEFPVGWKIVRVAGRGAMLKSPGVGLMIVEHARRFTVTVEYLERVVETKTVERFAELFAEALTSSEVAAG